MIAAVVAASAAGFAAQAPTTTHPIPRVVRQDGRYALMVDGAPYLMLGAQSGNSSDWPATLPQVWRAIDYRGSRYLPPRHQAYLKTLEVYHRPDNPLFVPETMGSPLSARFFFSALGLQAIGYSPFGLDYTRTRPAMPGQPNSKNAFLDPTARNYRLIAPMMREIARLNFEGKLQATAELDDESPQMLHFRDWDAVITFNFRRFPMQNANEKRDPLGRALVAQLGASQFLVTGIDCVVDFRPTGTPEQQRAGNIVFGTGQEPSARIDGKWIHRQFLRVEEGQYVDGVFQFERILNGDQTDYGLPFTSAPEVLHVSLSTY